MAKIDTRAVQDPSTLGSVEMIVTGELLSGREFQRNDTVLFIDEGKEHINEENHGSVAY
jgi:hypothetical protein